MVCISAAGTTGGTTKAGVASTMCSMVVHQVCMHTTGNLHWAAVSPSEITHEALSGVGERIAFEKLTNLGVKPKKEIQGYKYSSKLLYGPNRNV